MSRKQNDRHSPVMHLPRANFDQITLHSLYAATRHAPHPAGPQKLSICKSLQHLHGKHVGCLACKAHKRARHTSVQGIQACNEKLHTGSLASLRMQQPKSSSVACSSIVVISWHIKHTTPSMGKDLILTSSKDTHS